jgi:hypothetical protein
VRRHLRLEIRGQLESHTGLRGGDFCDVPRGFAELAELLDAVSEWIEQHRRLGEGRFQQHDAWLQELQIGNVRGV